MTSGPRVRFFFPDPLRDADPVPPRAPIVDRFRSAAINALLLHDCRPLTPLAARTVACCAPRVGLHMAVMRDPRFDPLTPPADLYAAPPAVVFEFADEAVTVASADNGCCLAEAYAPEFFPVFECLETGVMTRACAAVLHGRMRCGFTEGCVFCRCVDRRFTPARETALRLEAGPDVVRCACREAPGADALRAEASALRQYRPAVCTDPSPDVARLQSVVDFRRKMWARRRARARTEDVARRAQGAPPVEPRRGERIEQTRVRVKIPDQIVKLCGQQQ
jgi:hypothetical protein